MLPEGGFVNSNYDRYLTTVLFGAKSNLVR